MNEDTINQEQGDRGFFKFEKKNFIVPEEKDRKTWSKGDLVITCHNCGNVETLAKGLENGIRIDLLTNNYQEIRIPCSRCNSVMSMHFIKSEGAEEIPFQSPENINETKEGSVSAETTSAETVNADKVQNEETKDSRIIEHEPKKENTEA